MLLLRPSAHFPFGECGLGAAIPENPGSLILHFIDGEMRPQEKVDETCSGPVVN